MQVIDPVSGNTFEMPTTPMQRHLDSVPETKTAEKFDAAGIADGVLQMNDLPAGVPEPQWREYLSGLAQFAETYPAAVQAMHKLWPISADVQESAKNAAKNQFIDAVGDALEPMGLGVKATGTTDRTNGPLFEITGSSCQANPQLPIEKKMGVETVVLRAQMAAGQLPPAAASFARSLPATAREAVARLLSSGSVSYERISYVDRYDNALYIKTKSMSIDDGKLVVSFECFSEGPGRVEIRAEDAGKLTATVFFDYYGSEGTEVVLHAGSQ